MLYRNLPQMNIVGPRYLIQCLSLMTLTKPWVKKSVNLSRTITYHRLLHANMHHKDGKTHAYTVHVKICRPRNDLRQKHRDSHFAMVSVKFARELANLFGTIMCFSCTKMIKLVCISGSTNFQEANSHFDALGIQSYVTWPWLSNNRKTAYSFCFAACLKKGDQERFQCP